MPPEQERFQQGEHRKNDVDDFLRLFDKAMAIVELKARLDRIEPALARLQETLDKLQPGSNDAAVQAEVNRLTKLVEAANAKLADADKVA